MPIRLCRHVRRLLPLAGRLLRPAPYAPLRPPYQRRQGNRKLCEVALTSSWFRLAVRHSAASPMETAAVPGRHYSGRRHCLVAQMLISSLRSSSTSVSVGSTSGRAGAGGGVGGCATAGPLLLGGGIRTRSAGFIVPRNSAVVG